MHKPPFIYNHLDEIVYFFQGGGALGAFQVGVFHALEEGGYAPDWMAGISIGAINSAIIAGNPPTTRLQKLYQFWDIITHRIDPIWEYCDLHDQSMINMHNMGSAFYALLYGQSNFFSPVGLNPWLIAHGNPDELSFYDTRPLRETLTEFVDFKYLNKANTRLTLGAVNVETGKLRFFDNRKQTLTLDHILASSAFPPGFPAVKIEGAYYWDGGLYSNTPLLCLINDLPHKNRLCFLVDLFDSTGLIPHTMDAVLERTKDINYAGHLDLILNYYDLQLHFQKKIATCLNKLPPEIQELPSIKELAKYGDRHHVHIAKIVHRANESDLYSKDYEFSNKTSKRRIEEGYLQTKQMLETPNWWKDPEENFGTLVHPSAKDIPIAIGPCSCKKHTLHSNADHYKINNKDK